MLITQKTSRAIESCIANSHLSNCKKYQELGSPVAFERIGSGVTNYTGQDSFLSQVIGWGFDVDADMVEKELNAIEQFYRKQRHHSIDIELSPLCGLTVIKALAGRGYLVSELNNISILDLEMYQASKRCDALKIIETSEAEIQSWASCVAEGFGCPEAAGQFDVYAQSQGIRAYHAIIDDHIAACATIAIHGDICDLGVTSTLEAFRGLGLQKALIEHRLNYAKAQGVRLATVTTEPGSISDLNIQKCGFHCAYTRIKFSKKIE